MRIAGVVAEYDPFHLGHAYHLWEARRGCDGVVAVMSGWFTQRGRAACLSKFYRARMALENGADAVVELPALYSVRSAAVFAASAVEILAGLGCDRLSFGCETEDEDFLTRVASLSDEEPAALSDALRQGLARGESHARAWGNAAAAHLAVPPEALSRPNTLLAVEYIRANRGRMQLAPVRRLGDFHGREAGGFLSASAIRRLAGAGEWDRVRAALPAMEECAMRGIAQGTDGDDALLWAIRNAPEDISLPDGGEGVERRLLHAAAAASSREEAALAVKCKRYTRARVDRLLTQALLGMTQSLASDHPVPVYARLLGFRRDGQVLPALAARTRIPIVTRVRDIAENPVFRLETRAADAWSLTRTDPVERRGGAEFTEKMIIV